MEANFASAPVVVSPMTCYTRFTRVHRNQEKSNRESLWVADARIEQGIAILSVRRSIKNLWDACESSRGGCLRARSISTKRFLSCDGEIELQTHLIPTHRVIRERERCANRIPHAHLQSAYAFWKRVWKR